MASSTGLDPKPAMIEAAKEAAEQAGAPLTLRLGRIEDFSAGELFDIVNIGRALHWLDRGPRWNGSNGSFPGMVGCWSAGLPVSNFRKLRGSSLPGRFAAHGLTIRTGTAIEWSHKTG